MKVGTSRILRARYAGSCTGCGGEIAKGARAWWDATGRQIWCLSCHENRGDVSADVVALTFPLLDVGEAGRSAQAEFDRLHAKRENRIDQAWGPFAGAVKFLTSDPQSTTNWQKGAVGERRVAQHLERVVGDRALFLHDRRIPGSRANIDLLAVASSGVWIVDSKHWSGKVEQRNVGGWFRTDLRLYVGGRDRSKAVEGMDRQVHAVRDALGDPDVPILPALCFVEAEWSLFAKPFKFRDIWVTWARRLSEMILEGNTYDWSDVEKMAAVLAARLRPM